MLLAIDTCGEIGGLALGRVERNSVVTVAQIEMPGKTCASALIPNIGQLLSTNGMSLVDLTAILIVHGPGSFTGVRVGVSAAKGLAEVTGLPLIAISRLAVLARASRSVSAHAVLDAGRREYYLGEYRNHAMMREALITSGELPSAFAGVPAPLVVCEEHVAQVLHEYSPQVVRPPRAADALVIGMERLATGLIDDVSSLDGNYLRRSDAELFGHKVEEESTHP